MAARQTAAQTLCPLASRFLCNKVATLRDLCGSRTVTLFHFRKALGRALDELLATGAITGWNIEPGDLVIIDKARAITQRRRRSKTPKTDRK